MSSRTSFGLSSRLEELTPDSAAETLSHARELLLEYGRFVLASHGTACFTSLDTEAAHLPAVYREQGGGCLLAWHGEQPVGFVAWHPLPSSTGEAAWELKRLWVRPSARGLGLGRTLIQDVLDRARAARRQAVFLDTVPRAMPVAYGTYLNMGFTACDPYNSNSVEGIVWLRKQL